jgi:hypothetical protein
MARHFGLPSFFVTISPADMDSALMLRLASADGSVDVVLPLTDAPRSAARFAALASNPVAAVQFYQRLLEAVLCELFGLPPDHLLRKSGDRPSKRMHGLFGTVLAHAGVSEVQGRGSLHFHVLLWTDLQPHLVQRFIDDEQVMQLFYARIDSMTGMTSDHTCEQL